MEFATSFSQLSTATGYSRSTLHGMQKKGQIPERGPDGWRVADVLAAVWKNIDPGRRSEDRSAPNAERTNKRTNERSHTAKAAPKLIRPDPLPDPAAYRARTDLPDDFTRGVLYATHALAYSMPTNVASEMMEQGTGAARAMALYHQSKADASLVVADPLIAIGLVPENSDDCGPYAPTLFCGFNPSSFYEKARTEPKP